MQYILEVAVIVHDPSNEPIRLGSSRYYVEQNELTSSNWPIVGVRPMTPSSSMVWYMPMVDGKPSGAIYIECSLIQASNREVNDARMSRPQ